MGGGWRVEEWVGLWAGGGREWVEDGGRRGWLEVGR